MTDIRPNHRLIGRYWRHWRESRNPHTQDEWVAELGRIGVELRNDGATYVVADEGRYLEFVLRWA